MRLVLVPCSFHVQLFPVRRRLWRSATLSFPFLHSPRHWRGSSFHPCPSFGTFYSNRRTPRLQVIISHPVRPSLQFCPCRLCPFINHLRGTVGSCVAHANLPGWRSIKDLHLTSGL